MTSKLHSFLEAEAFISDELSANEVKWHKRFCDMAKTVASYSKDPDCKVGAIVVSPDKKQFSMGYNGLPSKMEDTKMILNNNELKNKYTIHAEMNCILNSPQRLEGWTLYVTKYPCRECALAIVQSGITTVVVDNTWPSEDSKWYKQCMDARDVFDVCKVRVYKHRIFEKGEAK